VGENFCDALSAAFAKWERCGGTLPIFKTSILLIYGLG
jgi:hypothetical protein